MAERAGGGSGRGPFGVDDSDDGSGDGRIDTGVAGAIRGEVTAVREGIGVELICTQADRSSGSGRSYSSMGGWRGGEAMLGPNMYKHKHREGRTDTEAKEDEDNGINDNAVRGVVSRPTWPGVVVWMPHLMASQCSRQEKIWNMQHGALWCDPFGEL